PGDQAEGSGRRPGEDRAGVWRRRERLKLWRNCGDLLFRAFRFRPGSKRGQAPLPERPGGCYAQRCLTRAWPLFEPGPDFSTQFAVSPYFPRVPKVGLEPTLTCVNRILSWIKGFPLTSQFSLENKAKAA